MHAYLIMVHKNWSQLITLLRLLDDVRNDIFISVDRKARNVPFDSIKSVCSRSRVCILYKVKVYWGGYSQIANEMMLFKSALESGVRYDFMHLISGADLPVVSQDEIHAFYSDHTCEVFMGFNDAMAVTDSVSDRIKYYHFFESVRGKKYLGHLAGIINGALCRLQRALGVDRTGDVPVSYGANWCDLTYEAAEYLVAHADEIRKTYRHTLCADEVYKQTVLINGGFEFFSNSADFSESVKRYIVFPDGSSSPKTLTVDDYNDIMASGAFFARKFDMNTDSTVIKAISDGLL